MRWTAPPDKREIGLVVFALTVFCISYNFDNVIGVFGFDPDATHGTVLNFLGLGSSRVIGPDGRKLRGYRDALEKEIFGSWAWDEGRVAGNGAERTQQQVMGKYNAMWTGTDNVGDLRGKSFGETTVDQEYLRWEADIPQSRLVQHAPGYTILDNILVFKGGVYIVTDNPEYFPPIPSIIAAYGPGLNAWEFISTKNARDLFGPYGSTLRGVTWMSADTTPHNSTLISLWRAYSSLDPHIDSSGRTTLPPPHRLIFPQVRVFTDPNPLPHFHTIRRRRVDTGFHPFTLKAAFPHLTVMYLEDWEDYHKLSVPFVIERIVVADREAAEAFTEPDAPVFSQAFDLPMSKYWWEPIRQTLVDYFSSSENNKKTKKAVTYIHRQSEKTGVRLRDEDHQSLVRALKKMGRDHRFEVHIVSSQFDETDWTERMSAIVESTVILGPYGSDMLDGIFLKPSTHATIMEFFPVNTFARDEELIARSSGLNYIAWWHDRKFTADSLPNVAQPFEDEPQETRISVTPVVNAVRDVLKQ